MFSDNCVLITSCNVPQANSIASMSLKPGSGQASAKPPAAQLFDILPIKGLLRPGEVETVNFSFFAFPGVKAAASALCLVEGGPSYTVSMSGESNYIKYSVEPQQFNLGAVLYNKTVEQALVITNSGKVPYDFNVNTSQLSRPSIVEPVPRNGVVGPGHKTTIKLKVSILASSFLFTFKVQSCMTCAFIKDMPAYTWIHPLGHLDPPTRAPGSTH